MHPTGVIIIGGFLGSGKTTLLKKIVSEPMLAGEIAVLINEVGEIGLDQDIILNEFFTPNLKIQQLSSGCLCCTIKGKLVDALLELVALSKEKPPSKIILETSGVTDTAELSFSINAIRSKFPFYTEAVVTIVDAYHASISYQEYPELYMNQLRSADLVLLNKVDLINETQKNSLLSWILPLCPSATWIWTTHANLPPSLLLGLNATCFEDYSQQDEFSSLKEYKEQRSQLTEVKTNSSLSAITLLLKHPLSEEKFIDFLQDVSAEIFRIKGIAQIQDSKSLKINPFFVQCVGEQINFSPISTQSSAANRNQLVFIGKNPNKEYIEQRLSKTYINT